MPIYLYFVNIISHALSSYQRGSFSGALFELLPQPYDIGTSFACSSDVHDTSRTILGIDLRQILNSKER